jgi:curli biogenesis system outer membrane secretion channel CsgG
MMDPAEVLVYGTITSLEGGGAGLRVKMPWMPLNAGGKYYKAKVTVELRAVDSATGRIIAETAMDSTADSTKGSVGTMVGGMDLPVELEVFRNTPLELCIRDGIYRGVIDIIDKMPMEIFRHFE